MLEGCRIFNEGREYEGNLDREESSKVSIFHSMISTDPSVPPSFAFCHNAE